jgi:cytochrome c-type biogenesis protein CcmH/NrfF
MRSYLPHRSRILDRSVVRIWLQLSAVCLLLVFMLGAGDTTARYNYLGNQKLICTCGCNQILLQCNHIGCTVSTQEEAELRNALDRGDSDNLILQNFVQKYGPTVLAAPPESGFNLVAWIAPGLVFLLAMLGTALVIRKWKLHPVAMPPEMATDPHTNSILAKVRKETEL